MALHPLVADAAPYAGAQRVRAPGAVRLVRGGRVGTAGDQRLDPVEVVPIDDRRLDDLVRPQPRTVVVPPQLSGVAEGDVFDMGEDLVFALLVPHTWWRCSGGWSRWYGRRTCSRRSGAVLVPLRVVRGRAGDAIAGQALSNRVEAVPGGELGEHPLDHRGPPRVEDEIVQPLPARGLNRVGVRPSVGDQVPVGRAPA